MNNLYKLANNIKELRLEYGYTQNEIAKKLGISFQAYQAYEFGKTVPRLKYLMKLADLYDVSLDYLTGRKEY